MSKQNSGKFLSMGLGQYSVHRRTASILDGKLSYRKKWSLMMVMMMMLVIIIIIIKVINNI
jgi:hypothetical protein